MMMRLSPAMSWSRRGDEIYVHGESQVLLLRDCPPQTDSLLQLLEAGCDSTAIETVDLEPGFVANVLEILGQAKCLVHTASHRWVGTSLERQADYYCAMGADPDSVHDTFTSARIAILGVGGIGSVALAHLAAAGVGRFTLIDGDTVQIDNLNRQFIYSPSDVGRPKVDAAADWVRQRNPYAAVRAVPAMVADSATLVDLLTDDIRLVVQAADSPGDIRLTAAQACLAAGTAMISADCGLRTASWGPLLEPADLESYLTAQRLRREHAPAPQPTRPMRASFSPTNAIAASHLAKDILNWLAGLPTPSLRAKVTLDLEAVTTRATDG
jgi:hypothetical protein